MWYAIILGGGSGSRMGANCNKVLLSLHGEPVILRDPAHPRQALSGRR